MQCQAARIYLHRMAAHGSKIETGLPFTDEVFHATAIAVKMDDLVWLKILHRCDNEGVQMNSHPQNSQLLSGRSSASGCHSRYAV